MKYVFYFFSTGKIKSENIPEFSFALSLCLCGLKIRFMQMGQCQSGMCKSHFMIKVASGICKISHWLRAMPIRGSTCLGWVWRILSIGVVASNVPSGGGWGYTIGILQEFVPKPPAIWYFTIMREGLPICPNILVGTLGAISAIETLFYGGCISAQLPKLRFCNMFEGLPRWRNCLQEAEMLQVCKSRQWRH